MTLPKLGNQVFVSKFCKQIELSRTEGAKEEKSAKLESAGLTGSCPVNYNKPKDDKSKSFLYLPFKHVTSTPFQA